ncbi:acyl-CoA dehydrogenase [Allopusillimonas soli]|uniref:Acyl-CoA/acyl-ACP dehydrogenase n=1 Tax=Allopusillimonas soli TaxID=659016 RepID=A0A853F6A2_9BURK|nr:acyl-CoA dehydrogenase family protein [Allopusillimonas soli]NYT36094.1 acyl-CoA/acyl-ACP dehydrogenase [Allopusillimonas soli]TEA76430.1 acyl-CoA dehydrogenase [Allopusillimonas soli]
MNFELTKQQRQVYETVGELSRTVFKPNAARYDAEASTPSENMRAFFDAGLNGITISERMGGMGSGTAGEDPLLYLLAVEQTARGDLSTAQCFHIHCHGAHYVDQVGTDEQRERVLKPVLERGSLLNATGSEPGRTSRGAYNLITAAQPAENGYILNGMKNYATLGADVDYNLIFAGVAGMPGNEGHLGVLVPQNAKGFSVVEGSWNPIGMRGAHSPSLKLDNCFVDNSNVLGDLGLYPRERWQARFHLSFAAQYLGGAEAIFDLLREYLPKRGTASDSYTQLRMGEIRVGTDSVRWLIYRAAWMWKNSDREAAELFSMCAKHRAIENAVITMDKGAQIIGSSAFWADSPMSRLFRDLRIHTLHENLDKTAATLGKFHLGEPYDTTARL